ncbi:MAG: hypothetical protein KF701_08995 [Anaerolineales bacterium]|nr:MAG: hypothetical protein KF701_08995 [Anaerolineales bacterium]
MSRAERRWVLGFALAVIAFTSLPYLLALYIEPQGFTGFLIGVEDGNSYIAKMLRGAAGDWLFRSPYSTMPQTGALLYLPYLLIGKMLGLHAGHLAYVLAFHAFRLFSIAALCVAAYAFLSHFVADTNLRRWGLTVAVLGGGLGWLPLLFGQAELLGSIPLDFYSPETFGYLAVFGLPHLALARAMLLLGLLWVLTARQPGWKLTALWLAMALVHLLTAALGLALLTLHCAVLWLRRVPEWQAQVRGSLWAAAGAAAPLVYNIWAYVNDAYLRAWAAQNQILAPHPLHYVLAYGWLLPLAYWGWRKVWTSAALKGLSATWVLALPLLLYAPVGLQRRFAEGAWVLLVALALRGLEGLPAPRQRRSLLLFMLAVPSTLLLWLGAMQTALNPAMPAFRAVDEVTWFETLREQQDAIVLAAYDTGNALPAWAPVRVVIGHGPETVGLNGLEQDVFAFYFRDTPDEQRKAILQAHGVDFVAWGPAERLNSGTASFADDFLRPYSVIGAYEFLRPAP